MNRAEREGPDGGPDIGTKLLIGVAAGVAATWVLDRVDWFMFDGGLDTPASRARTKAVRPGGEDPAHVIATRAERAVGAELSPARHEAAGLAVHYAIGVAPVVAYAALRDDVPAIAAGRGALFGLGMFIVEDEIANPLAGIARGPSLYPWQAHARGLIAHLVYGLAADAAITLLSGLVEKDRDVGRSRS